MIIGGNNNKNKGSAIASNIRVQNPPQKHQEKKTFGFNEDIKDYVHTNPTDDLAMYDKSIAMLKDRLDKNTITMEEFNKKCEEIGRKKAASMNKNNKF